MHILLLASLAAHAQQVVIDPGVALQGEPGTFTENGVGAPSVTWDPRLQRFVMFFETQVAPADALCPQGQWAIGVASSEDGYDWQTWPDPVVSPTPGTPWSCYAAHPAVVRLPNGLYRLWFMSGQTTDTCTDGDAPAWGCAVHPGIAGTFGEANVLPDVNEQIVYFEDRLADIDVEIAEVAELIAADVATLKGTLATSSALQCQDYDPVCAPCPSITLQATVINGVTGYDQHTFCQPFLLNIPLTLPVIAGMASGGASPENRSYIRFWNEDDPTLDPSGECWYKPGGLVLDHIRSGQCTTPVSPYVIEFELNNSASRGQLTAAAPLTPSNPQTLQGAGVDTLTGYEGTASNVDLTGIYTGEDDVLEVLDDLRDHLDTLAPSPELDLLRADLDAFEEALAANIAALRDLEAERNEVVATLDDLYAYRPGVDFSGGSLVVAAPRAGYPTVARIGGTWRMLFSYKRNIHRATSTNGVIWTADLTTPALQHGTTTWDQDELFSPSLNCTEEFGPDRHIAFYGGRDTTTGIPGDPVADAAMGDGLSFDFSTWFSATRELSEWDDSDRWRHWDMLRSGSGWRLWLGERNSSGELVVRTGRIGSIEGTGGGGRICD